MANLVPVLRGIVVGGVALFAGLGAYAPDVAWSQSGEVRTLIDETNRLRRDLDTLQRYVYAGSKPPSGETAPAAAPAAPKLPQAARLQLRITEFETQLRSLTGRIEELTFKIDKTRERLDKLVADVDFRLTALERDVAALTPQTPAPAGPGQAVAAVPEAAPATPGPAPAPQTLGTVTGADLAASGSAALAPAPAPKRILPEGSPQERYNFAIRLLRQGDWGEAQAAFQEFVTAHPDDVLASNAQYWLGETYYVRGEYENAATTFLDGYRKFPDAAKAPDSLLKLGMSLAQMGMKSEACDTFGEVISKHAGATSIVRLAEKERQRAGCG